MQSFRHRRRPGRLLMFSLLLMASSSVVHAQVEPPRAPIPLNAAQETRYRALLPNLRCMVCQNESLAASQAPLAADLRYQIRGLLAKGDSDAQVRQYLVDRYGQYVLYRPLFEPSTWLLWLGPLLLLIIAVFIVVRLLRRRSHTVAVPPAADDDALRRLLDEDR